MLLEEISLTNFKCFQEQKLTLSKITLLLGANSSGKSSLICAILGAIQSDQFPLLFSSNGTYTDMGDFRSISHAHKSDHKFGISLKFRSNNNESILVSGRFGESSDSKMPELSSAEFNDGLFNLKIVRNDRYEAEWSYTPGNDPAIKSLEDKDFQAMVLAMNKLMEKGKPVAGNTSEHPLSLADQFDVKKIPSSMKFTFNHPRDFLKSAHMDRYFLLMPHISGVIETVRSFAKSFNYVGAFRHEPLRTYYQVSKSDLKVGRGGENYIDQIADWEQRGSPEFRKLKTYVRKLKLLDEIRTNRIRGGRFEIKVRSGGSTVSASLADVGFGVSQFLPILVADLQLPKNSTLAVSQPEIHLHPSAQADLVDYFVDRVIKDKKRFIVETHSEYLLNRFRLLIARGSISPKDVSVLYLRTAAAGSEGFNITLSKDGRIEGAPRDFFQTYQHDVMDIAMHASK